MNRTNTMEYRWYMTHARTGGLLPHHRRLCEDARAAVVALGESDAILVVLSQVEVPAEPCLDARVAYKGMRCEV